ncbi:MAG: LysE family translocator [Dissulfurispiraceae bacterium]|jgi:threonine/homoserine/homoserine lactone efflux protein|nr:LysE family translocator [Dissulfurispiraceae bacterium]
MLYFLTLGTLIGLSSGFTPGPLFALVISETLKHGVKAGVKVALAPVLTDLPIIMLTMLVLSKVSDFDSILGLISLCGGLFLLYMAWENIKSKRIDVLSRDLKERAIAKGMLANVLNPGPYIFWLTVGAPIVVKAMNNGMSILLVFIMSFYVFLVGSKIVIAVLVNKSRAFFSGKIYVYTMRMVAVILCALSGILFYEGYRLLNIALLIKPFISATAFSSPINTALEIMLCPI